MNIFAKRTSLPVTPTHNLGRSLRAPLLTLLTLITFYTFQKTSAADVINGIMALPRPAPPGDPTLDFETLPDGSMTVDQLPIFTQYDSLGVVFPFIPVIKQDAAIARSGSHVLISQPLTEEFHPGPLVIQFTAPQRRVKVWVGQTSIQAFPLVAVLRVYNSLSGGTLLSEIKKDLQTGTVGMPAKADIALEASMTDPRIRRAEVIYVNKATGIDAAVFEAIDDLEVEGETAPPSVRDVNAPRVTITEPTGGTPFFNRARNVRLAGFVVEDRAIQELTVIIKGAGGSTTPFDRFSLFGNAPRFDFGPLFVGPLSDGVNTITVQARDFAGNIGEASIDVTFVALDKGPSSVDLFPIGMEITQAIAPLITIAPPPSAGAINDNVIAASDYPLVADKPTVVRVYAGVLPAGVTVADVTAELIGMDANGRPLPRSPLSPVSDRVNVLNDPDLNTKAERDRRDITLSWNFILPSEWTRARTIRLTARVNPGEDLGECPGCFNSRNDMIVTNVTFNPVASINITSVPVNLDGTVTGAESLAHTFDYLESAYPVPSATVTPSATSLNIKKGDIACRNVLDQLEKSFTLGSTPRTFIYGVLPFGLDCSGMAYFGSRYAIGHGVAGSGRGPIAAQEIGHNLGFTHASCVHGGEVEGGGCEDWPFAHGGIGEMTAAGFSVDQYRVVPALGPFINLPLCRTGGPDLCHKVGVNDHSHDFMSYGDEPRWISSLTWTRFYEKFNVLPIEIPPAMSASQYLVVSGNLDAKGDLTVEPFYQIDPSASSNDDAGSGSYVIELQRADGLPLFKRRFDPAIRTHADGGSHFIQVVPCSADIARIVVRREDATAVATLAVIAVSRNKPVVQLLSPTGGEIWYPATPQTIAWTASDADGDILHYTVQYSTDSGHSWHTIATDFAETSLKVSPGLLAGSDNAMIRVLATDGVNTGKDSSKTTFQVFNKAPNATIKAPGNNLVFDSGSVVLLQGAGADLEDGALTGEALSWSSSRDGLLGFGTQLTVRNLSLGLHRITLTVKDKEGAIGQADICIHITFGRIVPTQQ